MDESKAEKIAMANAMTSHDPSVLRASFLEEYNSQESIRKYTRQTAGHGISYLLDHEYGRIYLECIEKYIPKSRLKTGVRLWEFGCGGGMNLLHLVSLLEGQGIQVDLACGTDFSDTLIRAAKLEAKSLIPPHRQSNIRFTVASNETLVEEAGPGLAMPQNELLGSFDLVFGINTIRYGHRLKNVDRCVDGIYTLLRDGGVCIVIDMNRQFPAFRSRLRSVLHNHDSEETFLPTLDEYARPFASAGFEIVTKKNFCWIPHSAGQRLTGLMRFATPALNTLAPNRAMRSLVISRKLATASK